MRSEVASDTATAALLAWSAGAAGAAQIVPELCASAFAEHVRALDLPSDALYAEARWGAHPQLDLLMLFWRRNPRLAELPAKIDKAARTMAPECRRSWDIAARLVRRWIDPRDTLHALVQNVWFEFDDVLRPRAMTSPSLSVCAVPDYGSHYKPEEASASAVASALPTIYAELSGEECSPKARAQLHEAIATLPSSGRFIHLSWMTARPTLDVKLYGVVHRADLIPYLAQLGFRGSFAGLRWVLANFATPDVCGNDLYFDLNLTTLSNPRLASLGVAFSQQHVHARTPADPSRRALLECLAAHGQSELAPANALASWALPRHNDEPWRDPLVHRWLDLKCVVAPDGTVQTKAYLGLAPNRSPFTLRSAQSRDAHATP